MCFGPVHVVIGRRHDIGPVRLDVGQVAQPGLVAGGFHEVDGALRHVGRFGMFVRHARRQIAVAHQPARQDFAVVAFGGIGPFLPGIAAAEAVLAQIIVVGGFGIVGPVRVQAVVALERLEAALRQQHADVRGRVDAEPFHALDVGGHVGLADQRRAHAERAEVIAQVSARRRAAESRSRSRRANGNSARCSSSCATGRRTATAHRRGRSARPWPPARRGSASSDADGRNRTDNPSAIDRP